MNGTSTIDFDLERHVPRGPVHGHSKELSNISAGYGRRGSQALFVQKQGTGSRAEKKDIENVHPKLSTGSSFAACNLPDSGNFDSTSKKVKAVNCGMPGFSEFSPNSCSLEKERLFADAETVYQRRPNETFKPKSNSYLKQNHEEEVIDEHSSIAFFEIQRRTKGNGVFNATSIHKPQVLIPGAEGLSTDYQQLSEGTNRVEPNTNYDQHGAVGGLGNQYINEEQTTACGGNPEKLQHSPSTCISKFIMDQNYIQAAPEDLSESPILEDLGINSSFTMIAYTDKDANYENILDGQRLSFAGLAVEGSETAAAAGNHIRPTGYSGVNTTIKAASGGGRICKDKFSECETSETKLTNIYAASPPRLAFERKGHGASSEAGRFYAEVFGATLMPKKAHTNPSNVSSLMGEAASQSNGLSRVSEKDLDARGSDDFLNSESVCYAGRSLEVQNQITSDGRHLTDSPVSHIWSRPRDELRGGTSPTEFIVRVGDRQSENLDAKGYVNGNLESAIENSFKFVHTKADYYSADGKSYSKQGVAHPKQAEGFSRENGGEHKQRNAVDIIGSGNISTAGLNVLLKKALSSKDAEEVKNIGNEQYKKGHFYEALILYEKAISLQPSQASYHSNRAAALSVLGRLIDAVQACKEALRIDRSHVRARKRLFSLYLRLGQMEDAILQFHAAGDQIDSTELEQMQKIEKYVARCFEARKATDWQAVLKEASAAVLAGADSAPKILALKAEALLALLQPDEAGEVLSRAQRLDAAMIKAGFGLPNSSVFLAQVRFDMFYGRYQEALIAAQKAARVHPTSIEVSGVLKKLTTIVGARQKGNELFSEGRFLEASEEYGAGLEVDPANAILLCNRAACKFNLGQWKKSIDDCNAALEVQPTYVKARLRRAHSYAKLERWEEALRDFEAVRNDLPGNSEVARAHLDAQIALEKARGAPRNPKALYGEVREVSSIDQFTSAIDSPGLAVVNFIASWNERCNQFLSFLHQICERYPAVNFLTVDIEKFPHIAKLENIGAVPALKIYKNGQKVQEKVGSNAQDLECEVQRHTQSMNIHIHA